MLNNGPLLQKIQALDELREGYRGVQECSTDDNDSLREALYMQIAIKDKTQEIMSFLYWN